MKCEDLRKDIDAFVDGELEREHEVALREHLSACEACAREVSERRTLSASLGSAFDRALDGVELAPEERIRVVEKLAASTGGRPVFVARLAAVVVVGLTIGLVASALLAPGADPHAVARVAEAVETKEGQIERLEAEAKGDLAFVQAALPEEKHPAVQAANVYARNIGDRLARPGEAPVDVRKLVRETASRDFETQGRARASLRMLDASAAGRLRAAAAAEPRHDRFFVPHLIEDLEERARSGNAVTVHVSRVTGGRKVIVKQHEDGRVHVTVPGRAVQARNMQDLLRRHPELCRRYRISGTDGAVAVGDSSGGMDLQGRLKMHFRTGAWDDASLGEAYRSWVSGHSDPREIEKRWKEFYEKFRNARRPVKLPRVQVDTEAILRNVETWTGKQLEENQRNLESKLKGLDARLGEVQELRSWARALRTYAERLKKKE